ncbi:hypothetical protein CRM22_000332, partial [Opisthorchis felineus]
IPEGEALKKATNTVVKTGTGDKTYLNRLKDFLAAVKKQSLKLQKTGALSVTLSTGG